jgi:hypothetical protein
MSLVSDNDDVPGTPNAYDATVTYPIGALVVVSSTAYVSLVDLNLNNAPASSPTKWSTTTGTRGTGSEKWQPITCTLKPWFTAWPIAAGPAHQNLARHVFRLPAGYLRVAPQTPKFSLQYSDWDFERDVLVTRDDLVILRFVADVTDVRLFDPCFAEGLAARIGYELCESLTQSTTKKQTIASEYTKFMGEARLTNAIEVGPVEPSEDSFITVRL